MTKTSYRYWIAFRARYTVAEVSSSIGSMKITLTKFPTQLLFNPLVVNTPRTHVIWSDYRDMGGFQSGAFKNFDTQVISGVDNQL